jgi:hypothetical protein
MKLAAHFRHEGGPAGLVAGADACAIVAVEIFVEEKEVAPVGVVLEEFDLAIEGAASILVAGEYADEAFFEL